MNTKITYYYFEHFLSYNLPKILKWEKQTKIFIL